MSQRPAMLYTHSPVTDHNGSASFPRQQYHASRSNDTTLHRWSNILSLWRGEDVFGFSRCSTHHHTALQRLALCPRLTHLRHGAPSKSHIFPLVPSHARLGPISVTRDPLRRIPQLPYHSVEGLHPATGFSRAVKRLRNLHRRSMYTLAAACLVL